jgi:peptidyl-prolyl cis-trans isomerase C
MTKIRLLMPVARLMWLAVLLLAVLPLAACNSKTETPVTGPGTSTPGATLEPVITSTPFQPSPTPIPLAAVVNGEGIDQVAFLAESARYAAVLGRELTAEEQQTVLNEMIDTRLLAQAAAENGFVADETLVQARFDDLVQRLGGKQALDDWLAANGYMETDFRIDLTLAVQAAWMRDQVIAGVPLTAEQVHARQILLTDADQANEVLGQLQAGSDFTNLAARYDPVTAGDLGWFPRGYLLYPELEQAVFQLQPGAFTPIVQTILGFHILQVIERDPARALSPDALRLAQKQALQDWLEAQRSQAQIEIYLP